MNLRPRRLSLVVAAALLFAASWACAQDGLEGVLSQATLASPTKLRTPFQQTLAAADFDGDNKPDGAVLVDNGWLRPHGRLRTIELHFTGRTNTDLTFETTEIALAIATLDVNWDGATDIVLDQPLTHKRLQVWLNDGHGDFRKVRSDDFSFTSSANREQLGPSQPTESLAICLPPQHGSEFVPSTAYPSLPVWFSRRSAPTSWIANHQFAGNCTKFLSGSSSRSLRVFSKPHLRSDERHFGGPPLRLSLEGVIDIVVPLPGIQ